VAAIPHNFAIYLLISAAATYYDSDIPLQMQLYNIYREIMEKPLDFTRHAHNVTALFRHGDSAPSQEPLKHVVSQITEQIGNILLRVVKDSCYETKFNALSTLINIANTINGEALHILSLPCVKSSL
jgi:hypothetical protein